MKIYALNDTVIFKQNNNPNQELKKRLKRASVGFIIGTGTGLVYFNKKKNLVGKKLWINSIELGSCIGIATDVFMLAKDSTQKIIQNNKNP